MSPVTLTGSGPLSYNLITRSLTDGRAVQIASGARRELAAGRVTIAELSTRRGGHETPDRHPAAFGDGKNGSGGRLSIR